MNTEQERADFEAWWESTPILKESKRTIAEKAYQAGRAAIEADRKHRFENGKALRRYKECGGDEEKDPIERLRFYCSLAMSGQDWLDVQPFFDDLVADRQRRIKGDGE